jgi:hypothetical protein
MSKTSLITFYDLTQRIVNLEINFTINSKILEIKSNEFDFISYPVYDNYGINLNKVYFPLKLSILNNQVLFPLFIVDYQKIKNQEYFPNFLLNQLFIFCQEKNLELVFYQKELIDLEIEKLKLILKKIDENKYNNIEDIVISYKYLYLYFDFLVKSVIYYQKEILFPINEKFHYCGHIFSNISSFFKQNFSESGYFYQKKIFYQIKNSEEKFYPQKISDDLYLDFYLKNFQISNSLIELLLDENIIVNLKNLFDSFLKPGLYYQFIIFISSNNFKIFKKEENLIYQEILNKINEIKDTNLSLSLNKITFEQLEILILFLEKYPIYIENYLITLAKDLKFTLHYYKKNLETNFIKFLILYFNLLNFINDQDKILRHLNVRIKTQITFVIQELQKFFRNQNYEFLNNEKFYSETNYRLLIKYFFFDSNMNFRPEVLKLLNKYNLSEIFMEDFFKQTRKYHLYRNYFSKITWMELVENFTMINFFYDDENILLFKNKLNRVIFGNLNFKSIPFLLKNRFYNVTFLESNEKIEKFLFYNSQHLPEIFNKFIIVNNYQIKLLAKVLYLLKFVDNLDLKNDKYLTFISTSQKLLDILVVDNQFNLKIKEIGYNQNLNLGVITKNLLNYQVEKPPIDPIALVKKYRLMYLHYRKKYTKYKVKYFLTKYQEKDLKNKLINLSKIIEK